MEEMEKGKRYSAESKGYTSKIYEIRFIPIMERPEYQEGPEREALERLQKEMADKDFDKYVNNGLNRIIYDEGRLLLITRSEMFRTMLYGPFFNAICKSFNVDNFRVVSEVNGYWFGYNLIPGNCRMKILQFFMCENSSDRKCENEAEAAMTKVASI